MIDPMVSATVFSIGKEETNDFVIGRFLLALRSWSTISELPSSSFDKDLSAEVLSSKDVCASFLSGKYYR